MADDFVGEDDSEEFNDALDALASASSSGGRPITDIDAAPMRRAGRSPRGSAKITMDQDRRLVGNAWCKQCESSLTGQTLEDACPSCGAAVTESVDTRQLGFADHAWLLSLYKGMNLLAMGTLVMVIFVGLGIGFLGFLEGDPRALGLTASTVDRLIALRDVIQVIGGSLIYGFAIWWITRPRPDKLDRQFPRGLAQTTRWMFIPTLVIEAILGLLLASFGNPEFDESGGAAIIVVLMLPVYLVHFAAWVVMMCYLMALAKRIPKPRLAKATLHVTIALPATAVAGFLVLMVIAVIAGASAGPRSAAQGVMAGGCFYLLAMLAMAVWYLVVLFQHRRAFAGLAGVEIASRRKR